MPLCASRCRLERARPRRGLGILATVMLAPAAAICGRIVDSGFDSRLGSLKAPRFDWLLVWLVFVFSVQESRIRLD